MIFPIKINACTMLANPTEPSTRVAQGAYMDNVTLIRVVAGVLAVVVFVVLVFRMKKKAPR